MNEEKMKKKIKKRIKKKKSIEKYLPCAHKSPMTECVGEVDKRRRKEQERGVEKKKKEDQTNGQTNKETVRVNSDEG